MHFIVRPDPTRSSNLKARPDPSSNLENPTRPGLDKSRLDNISTLSWFLILTFVSLSFCFSLLLLAPFPLSLNLSSVKDAKAQPQLIYLVASLRFNPTVFQISNPCLVAVVVVPASLVRQVHLESPAETPRRSHFAMALAAQYQFEEADPPSAEESEETSEEEEEDSDDSTRGGHGGTGGGGHREHTEMREQVRRTIWGAGLQPLNSPFVSRCTRTSWPSLSASLRCCRRVVCPSTFGDCVASRPRTVSGVAWARSSGRWRWRWWSGTSRGRRRRPP